jgi:hypothetical protein
MNVLNEKPSQIKNRDGIKLENYYKTSIGCFIGQ